MAPQALIARQPKNVVNTVGFAPVHQLVARESGIGAQDNAHVRPAVADLSHDAGDLVSVAPSAASLSALRSLAASKWRPQKMYKGR